MAQNRNAYARMLSGGRSWDRLILTASNDAQAEGYADEITARKAAGLLPPGLQVEIFPDPPGPRPGSGGATFHVLRRTGARAGERVMLLHCGGESRRLPAYGPLGKLFTPLPCPRSDGRASTVFDEILVSLAPLAARMPPGWLVSATDVLLLFRSTRLAPPKEGVMGLGFAIDAKTAQGHGVYVPGRNGVVKRFLQKPSTAELLEADALSAEGTAYADSGVFVYPEAIVRKLESLSCEAWSENPSDLYEDWVLPMVPSQAKEAYLGSGNPDVRQPLWNALREVPFRVRVADPCRFVHLGSTAQWRDGLLFDTATAGALGFQPAFRSSVDLAVPPSGACILNSVVSPDPVLSTRATGKEKAPLEPLEEDSPPSLTGPAHSDTSPTAVIDPGSVVEASRLHGRFRLRKGSTVVGLHASTVDLDLPSGYSLDQLPVTLEDGKSGWVTRLYPIEMDPKATGSAVTLFGCAYAEWMAKHGLAVREVWPDGCEESLSLWNAHLFPVAPTPEESFRFARWLLVCAQEAAGRDYKSPSPEELVGIRSDWRAAPRLSFEVCSLRADRLRERAARSMMEEESVVAQIRRALERDEDVRGLAVSLGDLPTVEAALTSELSGSKGPLRSARAHWILSDLLKTLPRSPASGPSAERVNPARVAALRHEDAAFEAICRAVDMGAPSPIPDPRLALGPDQVVCADAPVRIDFAGGWLDTPPYSLENGGAVLNAALLLDGERPLRAWVRPLPEPILRLGSKDLDHRITVTRLSDALRYSNPRDPFALHKAAICLMGIVTSDGGPLPRQLERFGGGLELITQSAVPKGSGLGTSSILGGVALAALGRAVGVELDALALFDLVLALEQRMTTGGGWQDQIGGLMGGWKVTMTKPGFHQIPQIERVTPSPEMEQLLRERAIMLYSGYTRLARNILRTVVGQYLSKDAQTMGALHDLYRILDETTDAVRSGNPDALGLALDRTTRAEVAMDPHCWPPHISHIVEAVRPHLTGAKPAGAGGGGFLMLLAKSAEDRKRAEEILAGLDLPPTARAYPFEVSEDGLRVTVQPSTG